MRRSGSEARVTRLIAEHFKTDGKPKRGYPSRAAAIKAAKHLEQRGQVIDTYQCTFCKLWHIGHRHK